MCTRKQYLQLAALLLSLSLLYATKATAATPPNQTAHSALSSLVFPHGVAVKQTYTGVEITTRIKPTLSSGRTPMIRWEVSKQANFAELALKGHTKTSASEQYEVAIDMSALAPTETLYFRFEHNGVYSNIGQLTPTSSATNSPI